MVHAAKHELGVKMSLLSITEEKFMGHSEVSFAEGYRSQFSGICKSEWGKEVSPRSGEKWVCVNRRLWFMLPQSL